MKVTGWRKLRASRNHRRLQGCENAHSCWNHAGTETRTRMGLPPRDFKSLASSQFRHPGAVKDGSRKPEAGSHRAEATSRKSECFFRLPASDFRPLESGKRDSNPRPQPWQGCALPTELFPRRPPSSADALIVYPGAPAPYKRIPRTRRRPAPDESGLRRHAQRVDCIPRAIREKPRQRRVPAIADREAVRVE